MRTVADITLDLHRIERELIDIANEIGQMVPEGCDRNAAILEAWTRIGGMAAEAQRAKRAFARAILEG